MVRNMLFLENSALLRMVYMTEYWKENMLSGQLLFITESGVTKLLTIYIK